MQWLKPPSVQEEVETDVINLYLHYGKFKIQGCFHTDYILISNLTMITYKSISPEL